MDGRYRIPRLIVPAGSALILGVFLYLCFLVLVGTGASQTAIVDDDAPDGGDGSLEHPHNRIQHAIDNATDGDTIRVFSGIYFENVIVNTSVSLLGNGTGNTTIDDGEIGDVVRITADHVNMSGFKIVHSGNGPFEDYGVEILSDHNHIFDIICANNEIGIGILHAHNNSLERITINNNSRVGILLSHSNNNLLSNNICSNNDGTGISLAESNANSIRDNLVFSNYVGIDFSGDDHYSQYTDIRGNNIFNNRDFGINASENGNHTIHATDNYWGHSSGPYHTAKNPGGKGDTITDFVDFDPWVGKNRAPEVDLYVTHYFYTSLEINDTNDGVPNGQIDLFYMDRVIFFEDAFDRDSDPLTYNWTFLCVSTGFSTHASGDTISGSVGHDFLFEGLNGTTPLRSETFRDYQVTLSVSDGIATIERSIFIRVHPLASATFTKRVTMGATLLNASVTLTWRGFVEEAASSSEYISEDRPIYVFINDTAVSPDPNLKNKGGIGKVYNISAVGCYLQNGEEGFIEATIRVPVLTSDLEEWGNVDQAWLDLRMEYYDEVEKRFVWVEENKMIPGETVTYVVATVDTFRGIYATIIDGWHLPQPELSVSGIELSHTAAIEGLEIEVRAFIGNTGDTHARNVDVKIFDGEDLIGDFRIDVVKVGGMEMVRTTFTATILDKERLSESHEIKVNVNPNHAIKERSYSNNEGMVELTIITGPAKEEGERERGDEEASAMYTFIVALVLLAEVLVMVVLTPREYFDPKGKAEKKQKKEMMKEMKKELEKEMRKEMTGR